MLLLLLLLLLFPLASSELIIIKTDAAPGPAPCAITCVGTSGRTDTDWNQYLDDGVLMSFVNMSACGFVSKPIVTVTVEGDGSGYASLLTGTSAVSMVTANRFMIFLVGYVHTSFQSISHIPTTGDAIKHGWTINWAAFGYTCSL